MILPCSWIDRKFLYPLSTIMRAEICMSSQKPSLEFLLSVYRFNILGLELERSAKKLIIIEYRKYYY